MSAPFLGIGKLPSQLLGDLLGSYTISDPAVLVGPGVGMDAAVVDPGRELLVVKSDPITFAKERAPHYLVNVNANDLACLGATPRWLLVTALLPAGQTTEETVRALFVELAEACQQRNIELIGGHTEITAGLDRTILVGQLLGTVHPDALLRPGGAAAGHRILVTRPVAIEGTALLATDLRTKLDGLVPSASLDHAATFLDRPGISVESDARALLTTGVISALHDPTEGGLATGVRELAISCGCGVIISRTNVPVLPETRLIAEALDLDPLGMLASGSLLACVPPDGMDVVEQACMDNDIPFAWIGKITPAERGFLLREGPREIDLPVFDTDEVARALALYA